MKKNEVQTQVFEYLRSNFQMAIATYGDYPWIATVYYSIDETLNLYFLSDPKTIHCSQIKKNPNVAIAIADSPQNPAQNKKGIQLYGFAEEISGMHKIKHALSLWKKTLGVTSDAYTYEGMMKQAITGRMYKVTPKKIKYMNPELWKEAQTIELG